MDRSRDRDDDGARTFLAAIDIDVGAEFEAHLRRALNRAHELVVLITPWTLDQRYVWAELSVAWGRDILVVPLLLGMTSSDLQSRPDVPVWLKALHHMRLNAIDTYLEQLRRRIDQQHQGVLND